MLQPYIPKIVSVYINDYFRWLELDFIAEYEELLLIIILYKHKAKQALMIGYLYLVLKNIQVGLRILV
jgi:hypothetical protein